MGKERLAVLALAALGVSAPAAPTAAPLFAPDEGTRAALVIRDGRVVAKRYAPGFSDANRFISWSMAETVTAMLVGELVADGERVVTPDWLAFMKTPSPTSAQ